MSRLGRSGLSMSRAGARLARPAIGRLARPASSLAMASPLRRAAVASSCAPAMQQRCYIDNPQFDVLHESAIGPRTLKVVQGDITQIPADAVVHPTNGKLSLIGGVGTALKRACGPELSRDLREWKEIHRKLPMAGTCMTPAHEISAKHIIHVYSPRWRGSPEVSLRQLGEAVSNIFQEAEGAQLESIALPALGSGVNAFPKDDAVRTILGAIQAHFAHAETSSIKTIFFVLFDVESIDTYKQFLGQLEGAN